MPPKQESDVILAQETQAWRGAINSYCQTGDVQYLKLVVNYLKPGVLKSLQNPLDVKFKFSGNDKIFSLEEFIVARSTDDRTARLITYACNSRGGANFDLNTVNRNVLKRNRADSQKRAQHIVSLSQSIQSGKATSAEVAEFRGLARSFSQAGRGGASTKETSQQRRGGSLQARQRNAPVIPKRTVSLGRDTREATQAQRREDNQPQRRSGNGNAQRQERLSAAAQNIAPPPQQQAPRIGFFRRVWNRLRGNRVSRVAPAPNSQVEAVIDVAVETIAASGQRIGSIFGRGRNRVAPISADSDAATGLAEADMDALIRTSQAIIEEGRGDYEQAQIIAAEAVAHQNRISALFQAPKTTPEEEMESSAELDELVRSDVVKDFRDGSESPAPSQTSARIDDADSEWEREILAESPPSPTPSEELDALVGGSRPSTATSTSSEESVSLQDPAQSKIIS